LVLNKARGASMDSLDSVGILSPPCWIPMDSDVLQAMPDGVLFAD